MEEALNNGWLEVS